MQHDVLLHVDACVGGFMLPFARKLGYPIPDFDFNLPGVSSMSADLHKYGYSAKGASVVLYKDARLRKHQFFVYTEWSGGVYGSTTMLGTRPGGGIAAAWAALNSIGMDGYLELAERSMRAAKEIQKGIEKVDGLYVVGKPDMSIIAFASNQMDIYAVGDAADLSQAIATPIRMACATALPMGAYVADELAAHLTGVAHRPYEFAYAGRCISLGRRAGLVQLVDADDRPKEQIITGRMGALIKELICRYTVWQIQNPRWTYFPRRPASERAGQSTTTATQIG